MEQFREDLRNFLQLLEILISFLLTTSYENGIMFVFPKRCAPVAFYIEEKLDEEDTDITTVKQFFNGATLNFNGIRSGEEAVKFCVGQR